MITDGQNSDIKVAAADQAHIAEEGRIAGKIQAQCFAVEQDAVGFAAITAICERRRVEGRRPFHAAEAGVVGTAGVDADDVFDALVGEMVGDFEIGDDGGAGMAGEGGDIRDVVVMSVRDADEIGRQVVDVGDRGRVAGQEGVKDDRAAGQDERKGGVAMELEGGGHGALLSGSGAFTSRA